MRLIAVDLEPTPYKYDLWNFFCNFVDLQHLIIFSQAKNWSFDSGHNYLELPPARFNYLKSKGGSLFRSLIAALQTLLTISNNKESFIFVCGYSNFATFLTILYCGITKRKFVVFADVFNNQKPSGSFGNFKKFVRYRLRTYIFKHSRAILVCGKKGIESALVAGCTHNKVIEFPYVVDIKRMQNEYPNDLPTSCVDDIKTKKIILFFSGRMIERKGLKTLLQAMSLLNVNLDWRLWIEGDGIEIEQYKLLSFQLGIADKCIFLGFCQYKLHSYLLINSNIVIIPSIEDNWGIVVDEALQLGKVVISTDKTGSAIDRISHGVNGLIFSAGDHAALAKNLENVINNAELRVELQKNASKNTKKITPADNVKILIDLMNE